jgi:predicted enzyme related to lactoylglutathione lyase
MTTKSDHAPGNPSWVELASTDIGESTGFYRSLFGWDGEDQGPDVGHYTMLSLGGQLVGAISPVMAEGQPAAWSIYISTADADATTAAARDAGATVLVEPMDVLDVGRTAVYLDSTGAAIKVWQPKAHRGVEVVDEPNTWAWSELLSRDLDASIAFYQAAFGWGIRRDSHYSEWQHEGRSIGGLIAMPEMVPAETPSFWLPYIAVADVDAMSARAGELGGAVRVPSQDFGGGRFGVIQDRQGAGLGLLQLGSHG